MVITGLAGVFLRLAFIADHLFNSVPLTEIGLPIMVRSSGLAEFINHVLVLLTLQPLEAPSVVAGDAIPKELAMQFHIENMTCGGCVRGVTKAVQSVDPTAEVKADPATHKVDVTSTAPRERLVAALTNAGFTPA